MGSATDTTDGSPPPPVPPAEPGPRSRARTVPFLLSGVSAGLIAFAGWNSGGYFPEDHLAIGIVALVACAAGLLTVDPRWRPTSAACTVLLSLVGLAAWTGLSANWSPDPDGARLEMTRALGYAAAFLLAVLAVGSGRRAALLLRLVVAVLVVLCSVAVLSRLRPQLFDVDVTLLAVSQGRLAYPLGYWNALGAVAAMTIVGCIGLAAEARERLPVRALAAAGGTIGTVTLYLTISRAAGLALVAALALVLILSPRRLRLALTTIVSVGAGAIGALVLNGHPILVDRPGPLDQQAAEGGPVLVALIALAAGAAVVQILLARVPALNRGHRDARLRPTRSGGAIAWGVPTAVVILVLVGVYATSSDTVEGQAANGTASVRSFVDRQYGAFMDTAKPPPVGQARITSARSSRSDAYRVAIDGFQANPLVGDGAAGYTVRWFRHREVPEDFRNAHSLELEVAAELGLVGLLLLAGVLVPFGAGMSALRRPLRGLTRSQGAAAGGIVTVWLVHSALDWDWQMAAVTLPALTCGAALLAGGQGSGRSRAAMFARRRTAGMTGARSHG